MPALKVEMKKLDGILNDKELEKVANISCNLLRRLGMSIEEATKLVNPIKERRIDDIFEDLISSVHEMEDEKDKVIEEKDKVIEEKDKTIAVAVGEKDKAVEEKDKAVEEKDKAVEEKDKAVEEKDKALEAKRIILRNSVKVLFGQGKTAEGMAGVLEAGISEANPIYDEVSAQCSA